MTSSLSVVGGSAGVLEVVRDKVAIVTDRVGRLVCVRTRGSDSELCRSTLDCDRHRARAHTRSGQARNRPAAAAGSPNTTIIRQSTSPHKQPLTNSVTLPTPFYQPR